MPELKKAWQWRWMQVTVFSIGILSIVLVQWVDRVSERQRVEEALIDTVMAAQLNTVLYHLRLEEVLSEYDAKTTDATEALAALDQAITQIDALGRAILARGMISEPMTDSPLNARAEATMTLLLEFKTAGLERLRNPKKQWIGSPLERTFEKIFKETLRKMRDLHDFLELQEARNQEKARRLFRGILVAWTVFVALATAGLWFLARQRKSAADKLVTANTQLLSQTEELTEHRQHLAELVSKRTAELTDTNAMLRQEIAERKRAEETLTESEKRTEELASRLINAQEIERKRIAMELHDELGQALNATKLHLRIIENGLRKDQRAIREECEKLLEYVDHVIKDVRRLSLALSPTILEDLGLTAAIQWLISGFARYPAEKVTVDIENIDHCFPEKHRITIYRVLQEILTNIRKHARAEQISIVIRRQGDALAFSVEDNGTGFYPKQESTKAAYEKGLGLATMSERVRMAGGKLKLWSELGKGTRITFTIPLGKGEA